MLGGEALEPEIATPQCGEARREFAKDKRLRPRGHSQGENRPPQKERFIGPRLGLACTWRCRAQGPLDQEPAPLRRGFHGLSSSPRWGRLFSARVQTQIGTRPNRYELKSARAPAPRFGSARNVHVKFRLGGVGRPSPAWVFFQNLAVAPPVAAVIFVLQAELFLKAPSINEALTSLRSSTYNRNHHVASPQPGIQALRDRWRSLHAPPAAARQTTPPCADAKDEADGGCAGGQLPAAMKITGGSPTSFQSALGFDIRVGLIWHGGSPRLNTCSREWNFNAQGNLIAGQLDLWRRRSDECGHGG